MKLGILGGGGLGREVLVLADQINALDKRWDEIVFIDDYIAETTIKGHRNLPFSEVVRQWTNQEIEMVVGIGEPKIRADLRNLVKQHGFSLATLIHPGVSIPSCTVLGEGVVVCQGASVSCDIVIGENACIQPISGIGHDTVIGKDSVVGSFAFVAGRCRIGDECYIATGVMVREKQSIGNRCILGMGAVVLEDIPDDFVAWGTPARLVKKNDDRQVFRNKIMTDAGHASSDHSTDAQ